ncbi:hypothetical protein EV359DRAFT_69261 [Lentinula novae-zelandiae]|nr:hypothetical protein EV359DRAFT_69261 [Lentinula novae-zelandiae]
MTTPPAPTSARVSHAPGALPSPPNRPSSDVDEILLLFKSVFGVGVSLARYIVDDPLWSILAAAGLPCPTCIRGKKEGSCSIVPHLTRCSNCNDKKPCVLGCLARFRYFSPFARRFLEIHGDPGQHTRYSLPTEQWRVIYDRVKQRTDLTSALLELNPLDDQDQRELDRQELWEFRQCQLLVPGPLVPHSSLLASDSSPLPRAPIMKKRKRPVKVDSGTTPKCRHPEQPVDRSSPIAPTVPQVEGASDYRRMVLVLCLPPCSRFGASHFAGSRAPRSCGFLPSVGC